MHIICFLAYSFPKKAPSSLEMKKMCFSAMFDDIYKEVKPNLYYLNI